jgi:hypothetical protein
MSSQVGKASSYLGLVQQLDWDTDGARHDGGMSGVRREKKVNGLVASISRVWSVVRL